jgi:hypothetical protein
MKLTEEFCQIFLSTLTSSSADVFTIKNMTQALIHSHDYVAAESPSSASLNDEDDIARVCSQFQAKSAQINYTDSIKYKLVKYVYPVLILFGLFGNFVSFLAMFKKFMTEKKSNVSRNNKGNY